MDAHTLVVNPLDARAAATASGTGELAPGCSPKSVRGTHQRESRWACSNTKSAFLGL